VSLARPALRTSAHPRGWGSVAADGAGAGVGMGVGVVGASDADPTAEGEPCAAGRSSAGGAVVTEASARETDEVRSLSRGVRPIRTAGSACSVPGAHTAVEAPPAEGLASGAVAMAPTTVAARARDAAPAIVHRFPVPCTGAR
jgi:hypothetical protein